MEYEFPLGWLGKFSPAPTRGGGLRACSRFRHRVTAEAFVLSPESRPLPKAVCIDGNICAKSRPCLIMFSASNFGIQSAASRIVERGNGADVVIIGAGLAGLCCARRLARSRSHLTVEASDSVAGVAACAHRQSGKVFADRGFQVLLTAYPGSPPHSIRYFRLN